MSTVSNRRPVWHAANVHGLHVYCFLSTLMLIKIFLCWYIVIE